MFMEMPHFLLYPTLLAEKSDCVLSNVLFSRTAWVQKIKAASENFIDTEKKKRERAYQGTVITYIHIIIKESRPHPAVGSVYRYNSTFEVLYLGITMAKAGSFSLWWGGLLLKPQGDIRFQDVMKLQTPIQNLLYWPCRCANYLLLSLYFIHLWCSICLRRSD